MSERDFQRTVIDLAHTLGWRVAHFRPGMTSRIGKDGKPVWTTPVEADGAGFPDLILVRCPRVIAAELKSEQGKISDEQLQWQLAFAGTGVMPCVWRPSDWDAIVEVLK